MRILNKKYWPHRVVLNCKNYDNFDDMREWLHGSLKCEWQVVQGMSDKTLDFYFKEAKDATMFVLKWGDAT